MTGPARYTESPWPVLRNAVEGLLELHRPHTVWALGEVDVTDTLAALAAARRRSRLAVPFQAYAIHCLATAAAEHPAVLTYRRGDRLLTFADADVMTVVDKPFPGGYRLPAGYIVERAQEKSLAEINLELRNAVREDQGHTEAVRLRRRLARMPRLVRRAIGWRMSRDPLLLRRHFGTIALTTVQTPGDHNPSWALPTNLHTFTVALGTVSERVALDAEGRPVRRRILHVTGAADHLVLDGMAMTRFSHRFTGLLGGAHGLDALVPAPGRDEAEATPA